MTNITEENQVMIFPDVVNIRNVAAVCGDILSFINKKSGVTIDLTECREIDISGIQMIESARILARTQGSELALSAPASGAVADVLHRSGLVAAFRPADAGFWFHKEGM